MYGTTEVGGLNERGIAWEITTSGAYKILHQFGGTTVNADGAGGPDGAYPFCRVAFDTTGNMYGTTYEGGAKNLGMLWEITTAGKYWDLHDFGGTAVNPSGASRADGSHPRTGVSFDSEGNMYGTTASGGPNPGQYGNGGGIVWEITTAGTYLDLHDFGGTVLHATGTVGFDGSTPESEVIFDSTGNLYGTTTQGGPAEDYGSLGVGMVWKITKTGLYLDLHDFGITILDAHGVTGPDGELPGEITLDSVGNLYGVTTRGGSFDVIYYPGNPLVGDGLLWEIPKSGSYKDLHDFGGPIVDAEGKIGKDGISPGAITVDGQGNMFGVTESGGPCILKSGNPTGILWEKTKTGAYKDLHDFGAIAGYPGGSDGCWPNGVTIDSSGALVGTTNTGGTYPVRHRVEVGDRPGQPSKLHPHP
jgi:hypothetical protein